MKVQIVWSKFTVIIWGQKLGGKQSFFFFLLFVLANDPTNKSSANKQAFKKFEMVPVNEQHPLQI
jgi:hypothetical protein